MKGLLTILFAFAFMALMLPFMVVGFICELISTGFGVGRDLFDKLFILIDVEMKKINKSDE